MSFSKFLCCHLILTYFLYIDLLLPLFPWWVFQAIWIQCLPDLFNSLICSSGFWLWTSFLLLSKIYVITSHINIIWILLSSSSTMCTIVSKNAFFYPPVSFNSITSLFSLFSSFSALEDVSQNNYFNVKKLMRKILLLFLCMSPK